MQDLVLEEERKESEQIPIVQEPIGAAQIYESPADQNLQRWGTNPLGGSTPGETGEGSDGDEENPINPP